MKKFGFSQLFTLSLLATSSQFVFAGNALLPPNKLQTSKAGDTCTVNFGYGAKLHVPSTLTRDCDQGHKELVSEYISFFVHYPSLKLAPEVEHVHDTREKFQIFVTSFYQNPNNHASLGSWPSTYVQNHIDEFGQTKNYPSAYRGLLKIMLIKAMKEHPDIDTRHAPGIFIADLNSENQFYLLCGSPEGQCRASVYNTKNHFEYEMYYPGFEVDRTIEIVNTIAKMVDSWK